jgi:hypothetical protein
MDEEYNPFQSPEAPPAPSYPLPGSLRRPHVVPFASGHVRAMFTVSLLALVAVTDLIAIWAFTLQNELLDSIMHRQMPDPGVADANDQRILAIAIANKLAYVGAGIAYLMWCHRAYRNLPALGAKVLDSTPGWAVGWYFVPIAFLFKPCQSMSEIWRYSDPAQHGTIRKSTSPLVGVWWAAFLITIFFDRFSTVNAIGVKDHPTLESLKDISNTALTACAIEFVAALLAITLVFWIDKNQQATNDLIAAQPPGEATRDPYYG